MGNYKNFTGASVQVSAIEVRQFMMQTLGYKIKSEEQKQDNTKIWPQEKKVELQWKKLKLLYSTPTIPFFPHFIMKLWEKWNYWKY